MSLLLLDGASQPTRAERIAIAANFCNVFQADGMCIFTAFLPQAETLGLYDDWMRRLIAAGSTHMVISTFAAYRIDGNQYMAAFDWIDQPQRFATFIKKVSDTRGANGKALTPIIFLDDGGPDPYPRIGKWPAVAAALRDAGVIDRCIIVPAWEPVVGDWSSADLSYALGCVRTWFPEALLGCHFSPTRWVGSSNPVVPSDPWQGGEASFYKEFNGQFIDIALYQAPADAVVFPHCDYLVEDCWLSRFYDGLVRLGTGYHGWRVLNVCCAEGPAFLCIRGHATSEDAVVWATAAHDLAVSLSIPCSFMNGLPRG